LSINGSTGAVTGNPTTVGAYSVTVTATDARKLSSTVGFNWVITRITYSSVVMADGPLGYWRMADTKVTKAHDSTGNAWHGVFQGAPGFGRPGALAQDTDPATYFDGSSTGATVPDRNDFVGTAPFTLEAWVRPASLGTSTDYKTIIRKYGGSGYWLWMNSSYGFGFERSSTGAISKVMAGPVATGVWQHVVATYDGSTMRIYVNGALRGSAASTQPISDNTASVQIGYHPGLPGYTVHGDLDEVAIYGKALPAASVTAHYEKSAPGAGRVAGAVSHPPTPA
jgi:hypothetical protein